MIRVCLIPELTIYSRGNTTQHLLPYFYPKYLKAGKFELLGGLDLDMNGKSR